MVSCDSLLTASIIFDKLLVETLSLINRLYVTEAVVASRNDAPRQLALFLLYLKGTLKVYARYCVVNHCFSLCFNQDDPQQALILEVIRNDKLRQIERQK